MLTEAKFRNFRALANLDVRLAPFTVFVGPNGCGKSTVLRAIARGLDAWVPIDEARLVTRGQSAPFDINLSFVNGYTQVKGGWTPARASERNGNAQLKTLPGAKLLELNVAAIAQASYVEGENPSMGEDGQGLASVLAHFAGTDPDRFREIEGALQSVIHRATRVRTPRAPVTVKDREHITWGDQMMSRDIERTVWGNRVEIEFEGLGFFDAQELSEGTLLTLALITVLHTTDAPQIVLLDDMDRALHPTAQKALIDTIRVLQNGHPGLQVIATSHSPYLVDHFAPEEVRVMGIGPDGFARCKRLADHPDAARLGKGLSAGEWWASAGEKWVAETP